MLQVAGIVLALLGLAIPGELLVAEAAGASGRVGLWLFRGISVATGAALFAMGRVPLEPRAPRPVPWTWLGPLLGAALVLRAIGAGSDLWYDEVVTLTEFVRLPLSELLTTYTFQNNHILYTLLAKLGVAALGETPVALRLPAIAFGVGGVAATFFFARRIVPDGQALFAAALIAFSYHHVWFSQNARGYTGLMCLGLAASAMFLDGLREHRKRRWLVFGATAAAAMYVHLTAVFLFLAHGLVWLGLFGLARRAPRLARRYPGATTLWPLVGLLLAALLTLQLYALILPQMVEAFTRTVTHTNPLPTVSPWQSPLWTVLEMLRRVPGGLPAGLVVALGAVLAVHAGFRLLLRDPAAALVVALPIPLTLATLIGAGYPHIWPRYFFQYQGFAALLLVEAVALWGGRLGRAGAAEGRAGALRAGLSSPAFLALALLTGASLVTVPANYLRPKQAYSEARAFVEAHRAPGERVTTVGLASLPYERLYAPEWTTIGDAEELARLERTSPGTWVVYSFPTYMQVAHPDVLEVTEQRYEERAVLRGTLGDGALYVYHRSAGP